MKSEAARGGDGSQWAEQ